MKPDARAVVFGYSDIGVRGLSALLATGFDVCLVVTHADAPGENIWFGSVAALAELNGIPVITPEDPNTPEVIGRLRNLAPHWIFSFYYRRMLAPELLATAPRGAFNLHGSLLPRYRGRAPVNWAVLMGERETGASLHRMVAKPDAGNLVDQQAVPILPNDTARAVHERVACAAEMVLMRVLPAMLTGDISETPLDLAKGSYFGGRKPEDGVIDWRGSAWSIHNLIRAVAPPWPGAFFDLTKGGDTRRLHVLGSYYRGERARGEGPAIYWDAGRPWADCVDGERLRLLDLRCDGHSLDERAFVSLFGERLVPDAVDPAE